VLSETKVRRFGTSSEFAINMARRPHANDRVAGGTIGIVGAAASSRFARTLLFGVAPQDPVTLVTAVAVLLVVVVASQLDAGATCRTDRPRARDEDLREPRETLPQAIDVAR
jgi:hypothetical protein